MTEFSESDTMAAVKKGVGSLTQWIPQLPINPKSVTPTSGTYHQEPIRAKYKDGIVPARDSDYYNPSQLYPTTGPGNLAPTATDNFKDSDFSGS